MARNSRIPHPPGGRFLQIHHWAVQLFGFAGAAILGELDFLDRVQEEPGQPLASRQRLITELEGIIGRNVVDDALKLLEKEGAIFKRPRISLGEKNIKRHVDYGLNIEGLACLIQEGTSRDSPNRESREVPESDPKSGPKPGVPSYIEEEEREAAAPRAFARGTAGSAAAPLDEGKRKHPRRTANGIECWFQNEDADADAIESKYAPEQILAAVKEIKSRKNAVDKPTSPVAVLVAREIERKDHERKALERRAAAEAADQARFAARSPTDLAAQQVGEKLLKNVLGKVRPQRSPATP